jgi:hypothetical protein
MPSRAQSTSRSFGSDSAGCPLETSSTSIPKEADGTLEAAWEVGVRYFDVAPWYGFGLAERRFGHFLHNKKREDYLLSSKVGKLFKASKNNRHAEIYPLSTLRTTQCSTKRRTVGAARSRITMQLLAAIRWEQCFSMPVADDWPGGTISCRIPVSDRQLFGFFLS